jgi:hypothetical protein
MSNRTKKTKRGGCVVCYDCGWVINDEAKTPFYETSFKSLAPGDELIRCWVCNHVETSLVPPDKGKKQSSAKYKNH